MVSVIDVRGWSRRSGARARSTEELFLRHYADELAGEAAAATDRP